MKKTLPIIVFATLLFAQCKVVKYTPNKLPSNQIIFGDGGGFADIETSYVLLENGQIFKQVGTEGRYQELKSINGKAAKVYFEKVASLQLYKMDIEKPGNLYYFLQEVNEAIDSRVTWGAGDYLPPQGIVATYKELHRLAKGQEVVKAGEKAIAAKKGGSSKKKKEKKKAGW